MAATRKVTKESKRIVDRLISFEMARLVVAYWVIAITIRLTVLLFTGK
jgi:hypothetical protein